MLIYSVTDTHGDYLELKKALNKVEGDAKGREYKVYFLGDYIDRGGRSLEVIQEIKKLVETEPNKYVALLGNHEEMFLEFLDTGYKLHVANNMNLELVTDMVGDGKKYIVAGNYEIFDMFEYMGDGVISDRSEDIRKTILSKHKELVDWIRELPLYVEEKEVIYIHAGIDRTLKDWRETSKKDMIWMMPQEDLEGVSGKVVVCGHVVTRHIDYPVGPCYRERSKVLFQDVGVSYKDCELCVMCYDGESKTLRLVNSDLDLWLDKGEAIVKEPKREISL